MSLDDITAVDLAGTNTTVVRALGARETTLGPSVRLTILIEEGIFLLETEPRLLVFVGLHELGAFVAVVELVWGTVRVPALSQDEDVVTTTERVREDGNRAEVNIGILTRGLAGGGTVEVPLWKILNRSRDLIDSLS